MDNSVPVEKIAQALDLDKRRVQQLVEEGLPKEKRGQYDLIACLKWYVRYLKKKLDGKIAKHGDPKSINEARMRQIVADAELKELELEEKRGQIVTVEEVEHHTTKLILDAKARILAVAPRLAAELVGQQDSRVMIQAKIEKALKDALVQLAQYESDPA